MQTQVVVNNTNITPYIIQGSYEMNSKDVYEEWKDANMRTHRITVAKKVSGSFEVVCSNRQNSITVSDFLTLWGGAVDNDVVTIACRVLNTGKFDTYDCFYEITCGTHDLAGDGSFIDILTIKITER